MPHHEFRLLIPALLVLGGCASPNLFSGLTSRNKAASTTADQAKASDNQATEGSPPSTWTAQAGAPDSRANIWSNPYANRSPVELLAESEQSRRTGNLTSARLACEQAIRINPFDLDGKYQLARISDDEGRFADAERIYLGLLNDKPGDAAVLTSLGWSYYLQGRFEESERRLQESLAQQPQNQVALNDLGFVYGARGNLDAAWNCFRTAGTEAQAQEAMAMLTQNSGNIPASGERPNSAPDRDQRFVALPPSPGAVRQADGRAAAKVPETQYASPQAKKLAEDFQRLKAENDKQLQQRRAKQDSQKISAPSPWNNNRPVSGGAPSRDSGNYPLAGAQDRTVPYGYGAPAANSGMRPSYGDSGPAGTPRNGAAFPGASSSQANRPGTAETGNFGPGNLGPNNYAPPAQAGLPPGAAQGPQMGLGTQTNYNQPGGGNQRPQLPIITPGPGREDSASTGAGYNQSLNSLPQDNVFTPLPNSGNVAADYRIPEWPGSPAARGQSDRMNQSNQVQPASAQQQNVGPGRGRNSSLEAQAAAAQMGLSAGPGSMGIPTGDWSAQTNGQAPSGGSAQQNFNRQGQGGVVPSVNYWSQTPAGGGAAAPQLQGQQTQTIQLLSAGQNSAMGAPQGTQSGNAYPMPGRPLSYPVVAPAVVPSAQGRVYGAGDSSPLTGSYPGGNNQSPPPARSPQ
ncbi:MAG TPA: tetratricopeptide repeat protein [Planctomycetaceae bacterium]|jgi:Flp pilus assembly protein TadD